MKSLVCTECPEDARPREPFTPAGAGSMAAHLVDVHGLQEFTDWKWACAHFGMPYAEPSWTQIRREPDGAAALERMCEVMHDAYERSAAGHGWDTNLASRKPWSEVPEANKATMRDAVTALLDHLMTT